MNQDIKKAILKNCGGMETATDQQLMTVWISLDLETQLKYMTSIKKEKEDASAIRSKSGI